jgi:hypothetical protein
MQRERAAGQVLHSRLNPVISTGVAQFHRATQWRDPRIRRCSCLFFVSPSQAAMRRIFSRLTTAAQTQEISSR